MGSRKGLSDLADWLLTPLRSFLLGGGLLLRCEPFESRLDVLALFGSVSEFVSSVTLSLNTNFEQLLVPSMMPRRMLNVTGPSMILSRLVVLC